MATNSEIIRGFVETWSTLDVKKLIDFFAEDGCYYNMPAQPVRGKNNVEVLISNFLASWTETTWDIINISESGNVVFCERLDRTKTTAGDVDLPCVGVFEMQYGKIKERLDYFDMNTFVSAMG